MTDEELAGWVEIAYRLAVVGPLIFIAIKIAQIASH